MKRNFLIYAILMPICYFLLMWGGNTHVTTIYEQSAWAQQAAPWLGEAPAGMYTLQITDKAEPYTAFYMPYSEEMEQRFLKAFPVDRESNPTGTMIHSTLSKVLHPTMLRMPGDMLRIVIENPNEEIDKAHAQEYQVMYPAYLEQSSHNHVWLALLLWVLALGFPSLFCCIGWLWIQRKAVVAVESCAICLVLPLFCVAIGDGITLVHSGQYDGFMTILGFAFNLFCVAAISAALMTLTALVRLITRTIRSQPK